MGHMPGQVFALVRGVRRFAGLKLYLDARFAVESRLGGGARLGRGPSARRWAECGMSFPSSAS